MTLWVSSYGEYTFPLSYVNTPPFHAHHHTPRRTKGMLDTVWVTPLPGLDAEIMANGLSELALVAALGRAYIDTRGGGVPAFEHLVETGLATIDPLDEPFSYGDPAMNH